MKKSRRIENVELNEVFNQKKWNQNDKRRIKETVEMVNNIGILIKNPLNS